MLPRHASAASGPNQQRPRARKEGTTLKIPVGERVNRAFVLPINAHNPPMTAVIEKLNAVDPAHERFGIVRVVAGFVRAPDIRDVPELLSTTCNFLLVKSLSRKKIFRARVVAFVFEDLRTKIDIVS